jgi:tape measure domain-containing protein
MQASTAMYQLSQAIAAGSVKLQDWNSVVNAGMGGELFQNALKKTAKEMGIVVDSSVPFRESLQDGWITTEVLTKTLAKFAEDESLIKAATQVKTFTQLLDTM